MEHAVRTRSKFRIIAPYFLLAMAVLGVIAWAWIATLAAIGLDRDSKRQALELSQHKQEEFRQRVRDMHAPKRDFAPFDDLLPQDKLELQGVYRGIHRTLTMHSEVHVASRIGTVEGQPRTLEESATQIVFHLRRNYLPNLASGPFLIVANATNSSTSKTEYTAPAPTVYVLESAAPTTLARERAELALLVRSRLPVDKITPAPQDAPLHQQLQAILALRLDATTNHYLAARAFAIQGQNPPVVVIVNVVDIDGTPTVQAEWWFNSNSYR